MNKAFDPLRLTGVMIDAIVICVFCALFTIVPGGFSPDIAWTCLVVFGLYAARTILFRKVIFRDIPVILTTELAFTFFYYLLFFHPYLRDLLGLEDYRLSKFLNFTFSSGANQGLVLAVIGYVAFHLGLGLKWGTLQRAVIHSESVSAHDLFDKLFLVFFFLVIIFYNLSGLQSADISRYSGPTGGGAVGDGIYIIIIMLCVLGLSRLVATLASGRRLRVEHWIVLALVIYWMMHILVAGDRNNFMIIALAGFGGAAAFLIRVRWPFILLASFGALVLYSTVEILRAMPEASLSAFLDAYEATQSPSEPGSSSFGITTATLRATFVITPDQVPYGNGLYKLVGFMGIVPIIRGYIFAGSSAFTTSADALAFYMIGPDAGWGVGSNILSDIYMDFALPGVPLLMAGIGYVITRTRLAIRTRGATAKLVYIYMILLGTLAEIPRYSLDFPVRMLVWGVMLLLAYEVVFMRHSRTGNNNSLSRNLPPHSSGVAETG